MPLAHLGRGELGRLFSSLFKHPGRHEAIVRELARRKSGVTRAELEKVAGIGGGQPLTKALSELEQCGFVRRYGSFGKRKRGGLYQLVDPFTLFALRFLDGGGPSSWLAYTGSPGHGAWRGLAFELVCLLHAGQMKRALGISGIATAEASRRSASASPGAQVDLVIDRADGVIDLCEMKFSDGEFAIDRAYDRALRNKREAFAAETGTRKAVHIVMVTMNGLARNAYWGTVQNELDADALFSE